MVPWNSIQTVLLDMDGTLLDKHFDDYFWEELIPEKYADRNGIPLEEAKKRLYAAYKSEEKSLNWTDILYWSGRLDLDLVSLKEGICDRVQVHPGVAPFLNFLERRRKEIFLVTNAHPRTVQIKLGQTALIPYFGAILCSSDIGFPKEEIEFWKGAENALQFDKTRSLFVDDNEEVLRAAQAFGIRFLLFKTHASSRRPQEESKIFPSLKNFADLLAGP